jgi:hypothetical protein
MSWSGHDRRILQFLKVRTLCIAMTVGASAVSRIPTGAVTARVDANRSETFWVKKHSASCAGFEFKIAVFAVPKIFAAGFALARAAPVMMSERRRPAFGTTVLNLPDEIIAAGGANQFGLKCRRGNRDEN